MPLVNLNKQLDRISKNNRSQKKSHKRIFFLVLAILLIADLYFPVRGIYQSVKTIKTSGKMLLQGVKQNNLDLMKEGTQETKQAVDNLNSSLVFLVWLKAVPFLGSYYSDIEHFSKAASYELDATQVALSSLDPYKQELELNGQTIPGQDRVAQALKVFNKIIPNLDKIEPNLKLARNEVEDIDTSKYPDKFGNTKVKTSIEDAKNLIVGIDDAVTKNRTLIEQAPANLGQNSPKTYLMLFQNDKELRATGGFITAYAFLKLDQGHLSTTSSDDIYRLDEQLLQVCLHKICPLTPPEPIVKYLPEADGRPRTAWSLRDSNISPDFPIAARQFESMYNLLGNGNNFDGIIAIDTNVVEDLIAITGPIQVFGTSYSANNDPRCNCPNVIYELEHYAEIASKGEPDRKAVLGELMQQILARSLGTDPEKMPEFINTVITLANDKHILFYIHDPKTEEALSSLNWTGEVKKFDGDYLLVNESNFAGGKSNLYVNENVTFDVNIDSDGTVHDKLTINYLNPQPFSTWLNGILRDYVRVYNPNGSKLNSSRGSDEPVNTQLDKDLDKTYFESFIQVRPQNSRILTFDYTLPMKISDKKYKLLIQKQPGAKDSHYTVKVNGRVTNDFDLTTDQLIQVDI